MEATDKGFKVRTIDRQLPEWIMSLYQISDFSLHDLDPNQRKPGRFIALTNEGDKYRRTFHYEDEHGGVHTKPPKERHDRSNHKRN